MPILLFSLFSLLLCASDVFSRGRPIIDDSYGYKRILTDQGTLLRGVSLSFDGGDPYVKDKHPLPSEDSFIKLSKEYGLNAVHVYLEGNSSTNPESVGINLNLADTLVAHTKKANLYLILTIGCNGENGTIHSFEKALDFWTLYAERYKNETHVIFEAHNEPVAYTLNNFKKEDWDIQYKLYKHIRKLAPESLILLGSFMSFFDPGGTPTWGSSYLEKKGVSWNNAAIAFHAYWDLNAVESTIRVFCEDRDNPALICTEFFPGDTRKGFNSTLESYSIGWLQFEWFSNDQNLESFREKVNASGTVWLPDNPNAKWPSSSSLTELLPYDRQQFSLYHFQSQSHLHLDNDTLFSPNQAGVSYSGNEAAFFSLKPLGKGWFALQDSYGRFLSAKRTGRPVEFVRGKPGQNERWRLLKISENQFAFRSGSPKTQHLLGVIKSGRNKGKFTTNALSTANENGAIFRIDFKQ
jgi:hypothetical protein